MQHDEGCQNLPSRVASYLPSAGQVQSVSEQVICWQKEWSMPSGNHDGSLLRAKARSHMAVVVMSLQLCFAASGNNSFICSRQAHQLMAVTCLDSNV